MLELRQPFTVQGSPLPLFIFFTRPSHGLLTVSDSQLGMGHLHFPSSLRALFIPLWIATGLNSAQGCSRMDPMIDWRQGWRDGGVENKLFALSSVRLRPFESTRAILRKRKVKPISLDLSLLVRRCTLCLLIQPASQLYPWSCLSLSMHWELIRGNCAVLLSYQ